MLNRLADIEKPPAIDISPILRCAQSEKSLIRQSAISALAKTRHEAAKEAVRAIARLDNHKKNKCDIVSAIAVLGQIGDEQDIEALTPLLTNRIRDIRDSTAFAIRRLQAKDE